MPAARKGPLEGISWEALFSILLLVLVGVVFSEALWAEFLRWDDDFNISRNPHLNGLGWKQLAWIFSVNDYQMRYQPLSWLTWAILKSSFGLDVTVFHGAVVGFHAANAVLVFYLIRKLLLLARQIPEKEAGIEVPICAALCAAIWAVHPMRVETTAWAVELVFVQPLFFFLASLLAYLKAGAEGETGRSRKWYWASVILFGISLASYPLALGGLVVYVALDAYPLRRLEKKAGPEGHTAIRRVWLEKLPFLALSIFFGLLNLYARSQQSTAFAPAASSLATFGLGARVMQAFYIWAYYVWKPFLPMGLTPLRPELIEFNPWGWPFIGSAVFVVGLTLLLWRARKRWPALGVAWFCHLAVLVPMLGLTEHPHYAADRYSLLPNIAIAALIGGAALRAWGNLKLRWLVPAASGILICLFCILSIGQLAMWQTNMSFFGALSKQISEDPRLSPFRLRVTAMLVEEYSRDGKNAECEAILKRTLSNSKPTGELTAMLGYFLIVNGKLDEAVTNLTEAVRLEPKLTMAWGNLGKAYQMKGDTEQAVAAFRKALELEPNNQGLLRNLITLLNEQGKTQEASKYLQRLDGGAPGAAAP